MAQFSSAFYRGHDITEVCYDPASDSYSLWAGSDLIDILSSRQIYSFPQLRSVRFTNGKHRRTSSSSYCNPVGEPGDAAGRPISADPFTTFGAIPIDLAQSTRALAQLKASQLQQQLMAYMYGAPYQEKTPMPDFKAIPKGETKFGEITGYRFWLVEADTCNLWSYTRYQRWLPGEVIKGSPRTYISRHQIHWRGLGIYAFSSMKDLEKELEEELQYLQTKLNLAINSWPEPLKSPEKCDEDNISFGINCIGYVTGTVQLWGDVVEHERGYRAEFARVKELTGGEGSRQFNDAFPAIQKRYNEAGKCQQKP